MGLIKGGRGLPGGMQCWRFPGWLVILASILLLTGDPGRQWFRFDRAGIADFELWRLLSAHFTHLGIAHYLLNVVGLILVWYLFGRDHGFRDWLIITAASIAAIDVGLWSLATDLQWYVGLSGVLHGLLAAGVMAGLRLRRVDAVVLGLLLVAKLAWEQLAGPLPGSEAATGDLVVVDAHLYGAVGGALAAAVLIRVRRATPI